jgi:hypothetical protein
VPAPFTGGATRSASTTTIVARPTRATRRTLHCLLRRNPAARSPALIAVPIRRAVSSRGTSGTGWRRSPERGFGIHTRRGSAGVADPLAWPAGKRAEARRLRTRPDPPAEDTFSRPLRAGLGGQPPLLLSPGALPPAGRLVWRSPVGSTGRGGLGIRRSSVWSSSTSRNCCACGPSASHAPTGPCAQWSSACCAASPAGRRS